MGDLLLSGEELTVKRFHPTNLPTKGEKEFKPKNDWLEKRQLLTQLDERFNFITSQRIEKANAISQAQWIPNLKKAKVTKKVGNMWQTFGHHQDQEDWLLPEEVLFLVENCELELLMGEMRLSVEQCTVLALETEVAWEEYRVFSFLIRSGMTVVRHSPALRITSYERKLRLDTELTQQKKPPLPGCSNETIIDEDISIIEDLGVLAKEEKINEDVIIIDDDLEDSNDKCVVVKYDKECSSSIVSSERLSREWYPLASKFLSNCRDDVIDLCNEEDDKEETYRTAIITKKDFLLKSKQNILNILPSAQNGISYIKAPDPRLLPRTVFPKYSEYRVNLNVRNSGEVRPRQQWFNRQYRPAPRRTYQVSRPVANTFNRSPSPLSPLLAKAQEMQAMAMTMIQTAASLMSAFQTENPNELWNIMDPRNNAIMTQYRGRGSPMRPAHRFKHRGRRYFNGKRESVPYRPPHRWPHYKQGNWNRPDTHHSLITPNENIVEIVDSDDENSIGSSSTSRKRSGYSGLVSLNQKRLKTEDVSDVKKKDVDIIEIADEEASSSKIHIPSTLNEDSNNKLDVKVESEIKIESVNEIKEEENEVTTSVLPSPADPIKIKKSNIENTQMSKKDFIVVDNHNKDEAERIADAATIEEEIVSDNLIISSRESSKSPTDQLSKNDKKTEEIRDSPDILIISSESNNPGANKVTFDEEPIDCDMSETICINLDSDEGSDDEEESDYGSETEGPTTWEEYKENPKEETGLVGEATLHLQHSANYRNILSALQIFKDIKAQYTKNNIKISYDVYLPTTKFKKSMKTLPDYRAVIVKAEDPLPSPSEIENLKNEYSDNIPFLFSIVTEASINFFQYDSVYLPSYD